MKKPALLIALILLAFSCAKKDRYVTHEKTTVEGVLLSAADRTPILNGKVLLLKSYYDGSLDAIWYGRGYSTRNVLLTDENGHFSHSFAHADDTVYAIAAEADGFFPNRNSGGYPYPQWRASGLGSVTRGYFNYYRRIDDNIDYQNHKGVANYPEIRLAPEGWISFVIENSPPTYNNDLMTLLLENHGGQSIPYSGIIGTNYYIAGPLRAGRFSTILYNVTSQGVFQFYEDSIYIPPHDTITYQLSY